MKIAFCSSEVFPFSKTGGLADVSGALPLALEEKGLEVKIFTPLYRGIKPQRLFRDFASSSIGKNIEVIFIKEDSYFNREGLYQSKEGDWPDNLERFSFYCWKSLQIMKEIDFKPRIIHCHDWQTGLIPLYLKFKFSNDNFYKGIKTIFTIHNLAYQGLFDSSEFPSLNLPPAIFSIDGLEFYGKINILKGALLFSDILTTVSPSYAQEIQTEEFGCGLEGVLKKRRDSLYGILNGLDYNVWDPQKDFLIYEKYSPQKLDKKVINKISLQKDSGLRIEEERFLLGFVGRLVEQKGIDLIVSSIPHLLEKFKIQIIILGMGHPEYHNILKNLCVKYSKGEYKGSFSLFLKFDEKLAHRIYAGVDCFLLPSRFEPCGLGQMISLKYATPPLVKSTGGLKDTITDYTQDNRGNGFVFLQAEKEAFLEAINRAEQIFEKRGVWMRLMKRCTEYNFSWSKSAQNYLEIYKKCLGN